MRCDGGLLAEQVKETGEKKDKNDGNPWVELLVSINDLLHNRSRPVSRNGEISAAKMGRWCGKTWLEFAPRRGRATQRLEAGGPPYLSCLGTWTHHICCMHTYVHTDRHKGKPGPPRDTWASFNFSCRDCVTVLQVRHTTLPRSLADVLRQAPPQYLGRQGGTWTAPPGSRPDRLRALQVQAKVRIGPTDQHTTPLHPV